MDNVFMDLIEVLHEFIHIKPVKVFLIAFCLGSMIYLSINVLEEVWKWLFNSSKSRESTSGEELTVSKIQFAREVIAWCAENLGLPPKTKKLPLVTVRYYRHKKWGGLYCQSTKEIFIYWNGHHNYLSRINTLIHEYQHFLDLRNKHDDKEYARELKAVGYHNNIYEKRARQVAADWEKLCYQAMIKKGIIKK